MNTKQSTEILEPELGLYTKEEVLAAAIRWAKDEGFPLALWKMPNQSEICLLLSFNSALELDRFELQELKNGFAFAPFNFNEKRGYFIPADILLSFDFEETVIKTSIAGHNDEGLSKIKAQLIERLENKQTISFQQNEKLLQNSAASDYESLVSRCIEAIKEGRFEKIVPARSKDIELPENFDLIELFNNLCSAYSNAFISYVSIPEIGSWLGATPEVLIERDSNIFRTTALAATQKYEPNHSLSDTAWNQKEIEEQAMVSRYIINCFKRIRLREFGEKGPETIKAGNLLHLKTTFEVDLEATNFPELPTVMLELLHPTSAVAGMPKEAALEFLRQEENLDRSFYSGFLGPVNIEDKTNIFVNLRCMELAGNKARLYAGAGVTAHSNPAKEFNETEMKFNTLLNILNQTH